MRKLNNMRFLVTLMAILVVIGLVFSASSAEAGIIKSIKRMLEKAQRAFFNTLLGSVPDGPADAEDDIAAFMRIRHRAAERYDASTDFAEVVEENGGTAADMQLAQKAERADDRCLNDQKKCSDDCGEDYLADKNNRIFFTCLKKCNEEFDDCNDLEKGFSK